MGSSGLDCSEAKTVICSFIRDYVKNSGLGSVVVGLSGGIDSALSARLCVDALGKTHVHCLILPESCTPENDLEHARSFAKSLGVRCEEIDISSVVEAVMKVSGHEKHDLVLANVKARIRMVLLYEYANKHGCLVAGTSNKSESLIGYTTKYGDAGVDFQPIADLYKTQVFELSSFLNLPKQFISKKPTAGLLPNQCDEDELGLSYKVLDIILMGLEKKMPVELIAKDAGVELDRVRMIHEKIQKNQHKRHSPLVVKLGGRTPGFDWRLPTQQG